MRSSLDEAKATRCLSEPVDRKLHCLCIRFDLDNLVEGRNFELLQNFIATIRIDGLEVAHEVI